MFGLEVNVKKTKIMTHSRLKSPIEYTYLMKDVALDRVMEFKDLGVTFDTKGTFKKHVSIKSSKSLAMMGFVRRTCVGFHDASTLKTVFFAHVRSHVEYASLVWMPHYESYKIDIERVQRRFTRHVINHTNPSQVVMPSYADRMLLLNVSSLTNRRMMSCLLFAHDVMTNRIHSDYIRSRFKLRGNSHNSRSPEQLIVPNHRTDYGKYEPITVMIRTLNDFLKFARLQINLREDGVFEFPIARSEFHAQVLQWINV